MRGGQPAPGQRGDQPAARPGSRAAPGAAAGQPAQRLVLGDRPGRASGRRTGCRGPRRPARTRPGAALARRGAAGARSSAGPRRAAPGRGSRPRSPGHGPAAQQAARLERADQPVEHQFGVLDPVQQQGALHDVEGALRAAAPSAGRRGCTRSRPGARGQRGPGDRLIVVDQADDEIGAGRAQAGRGPGRRPR